MLSIQNFVQLKVRFAGRNVRLQNGESNIWIIKCNDIHPGSGCGSVSRAVAYNSRGPRFESSHRQNLHRTFIVSCIEKTKKRLGMAHFFKNDIHSL